MLTIAKRVLTLDEFVTLPMITPKTVFENVTRMFERLEVEFVYLTSDSKILIQYRTKDGLRIIKDASKKSSYETRFVMAVYSKDFVSPIPFPMYRKKGDRENMIRLCRSGKQVAFMNAEDVSD